MLLLLLRMWNLNDGMRSGRTTTTTATTIIKGRGRGRRLASPPLFTYNGHGVGSGQLTRLDLGTRTSARRTSCLRVSMGDITVITAGPLLLLLSLLLSLSRTNDATRRDHDTTRHDTRMKNGWCVVLQCSLTLTLTLTLTLGRRRRSTDLALGH